MIPLPEPAYFTWTDYESRVHHEPFYTADQMQAYAAACVAAETAALRKAATDVVRVWNSPSWNWSHEGSAADAMKALDAAIRAGSAGGGP